MQSNYCAKTTDQNGSGTPLPFCAFRILQGISGNAILCPKKRSRTRRCFRPCSGKEDFPMANETLSASTPARKHDRPLFLNTWFWVFVVCISAAVTASLDGITVQPAVTGALSYAAPQAEAALLSAEQNSTPALSLLDDAVSAEQKSGALTLTGTIQNHSAQPDRHRQRLHQQPQAQHQLELQRHRIRLAEPRCILRTGRHHLLVNSASKGKGSLSLFLLSRVLPNAVT